MEMLSPTVSATMGVMNPLLRKLAMVMGEEYDMPREDREQVLSLVCELDAMKPAFEKLELVDELDPVASKWRDDVEEMSYDMENRIDDLMASRGGADTKIGFIKKTSRRLRRSGKPGGFTAQIEQLKALVVKANEERVMYKIDDCISSPIAASYPGKFAIYKEATREELVNSLTDSEKKLKVVCIVGLGGTGKTTLAREVYGVIRGQFMCKAFVSVSQNTDMTHLLNGLQLQLGIDLEECSGARLVLEASSSDSRKLQETIDQLREYLRHKRYLIVLDDLWDQSAWNTISGIFANDGNGGRVIVTTRENDVALLACQNDCNNIYGIKDLNEDFRNVFKQLPLHLRRSLLYLGMYPEDHEVQRDDLVRQWIAEDFVSKLNGQDLEDTAKSYFNELVNRNLIKPKRTEGGEVLSFTMDRMMLEFIIQRCEEHKFVHVAYYSDNVARIPDLGFKVHRLSLQSSEPIPAIANGLLQVQSLALFGESTSIILSCKYVRVLIVEIPLSEGTEKRVDLTAINQLLELRYLKVSAQQSIQLPEIQGLMHLETLELDCRHMPDIVDLPRLFRLILPKHCSTVLPKGIRSITSLHTLHWFDVGNKTYADIDVLSELTSLRELRISNHTMGPLAMKEAGALASSIRKLTQLRYLHIDGWNEAEKDQLMNSLTLPEHQNLKELNLTNCSITRVPDWIGDLHCLCRLNLRVWKISSGDIRKLGEQLPSLVDLYLWTVCFTEADMAVAVARESFKALKHLELRSRDTRLVFEAGAIPEVRELAL